MAWAKRCAALTLAVCSPFELSRAVRQFDTDDRSKKSPNYAYVTMASVAGVTQNESRNMLWRVTTLAQSLQTAGSKFPLLVLTDATHLPSGVELGTPLQHLNARALPIERVPFPKIYNHSKPSMWMPSWKVAWHKLAVWNLTQFDKLVWLDLDGVVVRDLDWLFDLKGTWAQNDRYTNKDNAVSPERVCSGLLVLEPSREIYQGMLRFADTLGDFPGGDQYVIDHYFRQQLQEPVNILDPWVADFGWTPFQHFKNTQLSGCERCEAAKLPHAIAQQYNSSVLIPAFVHKGDIFDRCFKLDGHCISSLYGDFWRSNFCAANAKAGLASEGPEHAKITDFCKDVSILPNPLPSPAQWPIQ